ncbi:MAG: hypothetical protein JO227_13595 [Acetobacteraceae bacterium]|nr:hypothetical protein [Acetobacteraceae bacterium]
MPEVIVSRVKATTIDKTGDRRQARQTLSVLGMEEDLVDQSLSGADNCVTVGIVR